MAASNICWRKIGNSDLKRCENHPDHSNIKSSHPWQGVDCTCGGGGGGAQEAIPKRPHPPTPQDTRRATHCPKPAGQLVAFLSVSQRWGSGRGCPVVGDYPDRYFPCCSLSLYNCMLCYLTIHKDVKRNWLASPGGRIWDHTPWLGRSWCHAAQPCLVWQWCAPHWQGSVGKLIGLKSERDGMLRGPISCPTNMVLRKPASKDHSLSICQVS